MADGDLGDAVKALHRIERNMGELATGEAMLEGIKREGLVLLKHEFSTSTSAEGDPFTPTKRGRPALASRKLPFAFDARVDRGVVRFIGRVRRDWLLAHQTGWKFAAREVAANRQYLSFNSKGKLVAQRRIIKKDGQLRRGAFQRYAAAHRIQARELPERHIVPVGPGLPPPWAAAASAGVASAIAKWAENATK
jgi:hypothetical protein